MNMLRNGQIVSNWKHSILSRKTPDGAKHVARHCVFPECLQDYVTERFARNQMPWEATTEGTDKIRVDFGGACIVDEPQLEYEFDGLTLKGMAGHFILLGSILETIAETNNPKDHPEYGWFDVIEAADGYKFHVIRLWPMTSLYLTYGQLRKLHEFMKKELPEARRANDEFFEHRRAEAEQVRSLS